MKTKTLKYLFDMLRQEICYLLHRHFISVFSRGLPSAVLLLFFFCISFWARAGGFELPGHYSSGLSNFFYTTNPEFYIENRADGKILHLKLHFKQSTAVNVQERYWYTYRYNGVDYTDQQLGKEVFGPITYQASIYILVTGGAMAVNEVYSTTSTDLIIGKVPENARASEYALTIRGLKDVVFYGTGPIENKIRELMAAEKKKKDDDLAAEEKKMQDQKMAEAEKQKKETEEKQKTAANKTEASGNGSNNNLQSGNKADDDFWETGKKTTGKTLPANKQEGTNNMTGSTEEQKARQQEEANKAKAAADQKAMDDFFAERKAQEKRTEQQQQQLKENFALADKSFSAGQAEQQARAELRENTQMNSSYQSVEQLMAEYNQKMANINRLASEAAQRSNEGIAARADMVTNGGTAEQKAFGEGMKALGTLVNGIGEAAAQRKAQAALREERDAALRRLEADRKKMLTGIRTDLFARFKEGAFPLSSTKLEASTIYYFVYAYDPQQLSANQPVLYLSNVFPVGRYSDGTWPFKSSVANEVAALTPFAEVIHGYYTSLQEAQAMRNGMQDIFTKTGGFVKPIVYKGKVSATGSAAKSAGDFWETGKKPATDSTRQKPVNTENFWNN